MTALAALSATADATDAADTFLATVRDAAAPHAVRRAAFAALPAAAQAAGPTARADALDEALRQLRRPDLRGQVPIRAQLDPSPVAGMSRIPRAWARRGTAHRPCARHARRDHRARRDRP